MSIGCFVGNLNFHCIIGFMDDELLKKEQNRLRSAEYYQANKETILEKKKQKRKTKTPYSRQKHLYDVEKKYGITAREYLRLFERQEGTCAICFENDGRRRLAVDHCHETGKVRGLLCVNCNTGLGKFRDNITMLQRAIYYLELHHGRESYSKKFEDYERSVLFMRSRRTLERFRKN